MGEGRWRRGGEGSLLHESRGIDAAEDKLVILFVVPCPDTG